MADLLALEDFTPAVGEPFTIAFADGELTLTLAEARPLSAETGNARDPFALTFHGPAELALPQATYTLSHARLGAQDIFLVPVAAGEYEAIFT